MHTQTEETLYMLNLWFLLSRAPQLETLSYTGSAPHANDENGSRAVVSQALFGTVRLGMPKCLPIPLTQPLAIGRLRSLELKCIHADLEELYYLIEENSGTLKEIYLFDVLTRPPLYRDAIWIGKPGTAKPVDDFWMAEALRDLKDLKLDVLRANKIGYYDVPSQEATYDSDDPTGLNRSFDQRFIEAVFFRDVDLTNDTVPEVDPRDDVGDEDVTSDLTKHPQSDQRVWELSEYDAQAYQQAHKNNAHWKTSLDGIFTLQSPGTVYPWMEAEVFLKWQVAEAQHLLDELDGDELDYKVGDSRNWEAETRS